MENDEQIEEQIEETQDVTQEEDKTPTLGDYQKLQKELQTAIAQKKHYQEKFKNVETKTEINKTNETVGLTRDEAILIAKGVDDRVIDEAKIVASAKGISLREALDYPTIKSFQKDLEQEAKREKAQLGASRGGSYADDDLTQKVGMSREEHKKAIGM